MNTAKQIDFTRAAEIMGLKATRMPAGQRAMARIVALFGVSCPGCGGDGLYGTTSVYGRHCFRCMGTGLYVECVTDEMAHEAKARTDAGELAGYFAQAKLVTETHGVAPSANACGRMVVAIFEALAAFVAARA